MKNTVNRISAIVVSFVCWFAIPLNAQNVSVGVSLMNDPNIFDTYAPLKDRITELSLDLSKGWISENSYTGLFYSGSLSLYKDLPARNFQFHMIMLGINYHYLEDDAAENLTDTSSTSDDQLSQNDSTTITDNNDDEIEEEIESVHNDSTDNFLNISFIGSTQINKLDFQDWNNLMFGGRIVFRQPLGSHASFRPSYSINYYSYPNLTTLTNIQNRISLIFGTDALPMNWLAFIPSFGLKSYPINNTGDFTLSINTSGGRKNGDMSGSTKKTISYNLSTPSVRQLSFTILWNYQPAPATRINAQLKHFNQPSTVARAIPELRKGAANFYDMTAGKISGQNELYDDQFSYSGNTIAIEVEQLLPVELIFNGSWEYQKKKYTYSATNLADSVIATNREDKRTELVLNISRSFPLTEETSLNAHADYHFINNISNSVYFDFKKSTIMIGVEYGF
ncbi:MAG: hypothetical protein HY964_01170 [Ignavibacteriales bacterium]|nr:hypothetical protein [Ignavibacteriales bacterium]